MKNITTISRHITKEKHIKILKFIATTEVNRP